MGGVGGGGSVIREVKTNEEGATALNWSRSSEDTFSASLQYSPPPGPDVNLVRCR